MFLFYFNVGLYRELRNQCHNYYCATTNVPNCDDLLQCINTKYIAILVKMNISRKLMDAPRVYPYLVYGLIVLETVLFKVHFSENSLERSDMKICVCQHCRDIAYKVSSNPDYLNLQSDIVT